MSKRLTPSSGMRWRQAPAIFILSHCAVTCACGFALTAPWSSTAASKPVRSSRSSVASKVLADANIAERRRHQDGRILFEDHAHGTQVDIRASFYITINGEKVVLRLLNRPTELLSIDRIGMRPRMLGRFRLDPLDVPTGVVIITGPTGSGKTTALYSCVEHLNAPDTSIVTADDPVEYVIDGVTQCSIDPKINLTFDETLVTSSGRMPTSSSVAKSATSSPLTPRFRLR